MPPLRPSPSPIPMARAQAQLSPLAALRWGARMQRGEPQAVVAEAQVAFADLGRCAR